MFQNMKRSKLQIKLLSKRAELLNVVNCFAGQVTVLRANSDLELVPYQRALLGAPGPERFVIEVDGKPFLSQEHNLIGFGEPGLTDKDTVIKFLVDSGVPEGALESLLMSYGLEHVGLYRGDRLSADYMRRVMLLGAVHQKGRVLVLNDPFEPLASAIKERFAELVVDYARNKAQIVLVTKLSYRPESWINNEFISRVQVGENSQRTIGFGTSGGNVNELLNQVRSLVKDEKALESILQGALASRTGSAAGSTKAVTPASASPALDNKSTKAESAKESFAQSALAASSSSDLVDDLDPEEFKEEPVSSKPKRSWLKFFGNSQQAELRGYRPAVLLVLLLLCLTAYLLYQRQMQGINLVQSAGNLVEPAAQEEPVKASEVPVPEAQPEPVVEPPPPPVEAEIQPVRHILDDYPHTIQTAVLKAFDSEVETGGFGVQLPLAATAPLGEEPKQAPAAASGGNLFTLLETVSDTGKDIPDGTGARPSTGGMVPPGFEQQGFPPPPGAWGQPQFVQSPEDDVEAQARRERIHQKFLEAIRKASEKRQQGGF